MAVSSTLGANFCKFMDKINTIADVVSGGGFDVGNKPAAATAIKTKKNVLSLAAELHIAIAKECDDKTLLSLRQVCRKLEPDTIDVFARRFFAALRHELIADSIEKLCEISQFSKIARHAEILELNIHDRDPS